MQRRTRLFFGEGTAIGERLLQTSRDEGVNQRLACSDSGDGRRYVDIEQ